jgi:hypothetical protein
MKRIICLVLILGSQLLYGWNATGHKVVAQIAFDNLTPKAKVLCRAYLNASNNNMLEKRFLSASIWLDVLRKRGDKKLESLHYIDIPFSRDGTELIPIETPNASIAILDAIKILKSNTASDDEKKQQLKILIHVVGDIHQPLHTATEVSQKRPKGDLGGNLFKLRAGAIGSNLHQYWDNGAGYLPKHAGKKRIQEIAHSLEKRYSCTLASQLSAPDSWIQESSKLAQSNVYNLSESETPSKNYQKTSKKIVMHQLLFAGCRLAKVINELA